MVFAVFTLYVLYPIDYFAVMATGSILYETDFWSIWDIKSRNSSGLQGLITFYHILYFTCFWTPCFVSCLFVMTRVRLVYMRHTVWEQLSVPPVCFRPKLDASIELEGLQRYFNPGEELTLSCKLGHTPVSGPRNIVCKADGEWTKTKLICVGGS